MTIILEAFSPADGEAIIRLDQRISLYHPPYNQASVIGLPESAIEAAVLYSDFHASGAVFKSWAAVVDFLTEQLIAYRKICGCDISATISHTELLELMPLATLQAFLNKVENELIPQYQFSQAKNFLLEALKSKAIHEHAEMKAKSIGLLEKIQTIEGHAKADEVEPLKTSANYDKKFS